MLIYCMECEHACSAAAACPTCGQPLKPSSPPVATAVVVPPAPATPPPAQPTKVGMICKVCDIPGNGMVMARGPRGNALVVALGVFLAGMFLLVFFWWTIFLGLMGGMMMFVALFMGNGPKVWKCEKCQAIIPRG